MTLLLPLPAHARAYTTPGLPQDPVLSPAGYTYCYKCIRRRIQTKGTCPITGRSLSEEQLEPNELAIALIDQIEVFPAKRVGKHWVPLTDKTKKKITFGLRRLYKNTYLKSSRRKREGEDEDAKDPAENYDIYELFTYLIVVSLLCVRGPANGILGEPAQDGEGAAHNPAVRARDPAFSVHCAGGRLHQCWRGVRVGW